MLVAGVADLSELHSGEVLVRVDGGRYAMSPTQASAPASIVDGWQRVWDAEDGRRLNRAWATDFELWPADGPPHIYVSVRG